MICILSKRTSACPTFAQSAISSLCLADLQVDVIEEILDVKREDLHKHLVAVSTDGASVNVGVHSGICQRLRMDWAPLLENTHCYAHLTQASDLSHEI